MEIKYIEPIWTKIIKQISRKLGEFYILIILGGEQKRIDISIEYYVRYNGKIEKECGYIDQVIFSGAIDGFWDNFEKVQNEEDLSNSLRIKIEDLVNKSFSLEPEENRNKLVNEIYFRILDYNTQMGQYIHI